MIFDVPPSDFDHAIVVAGVVLEDVLGRILWLQHAFAKSQGGAWGMAAGKREPGEDAPACALRELLEETGHVATPDQLELLRTFYVRYPEFDFVFVLYRVKLEAPGEQVRIRLSPEHQGFRWLMPADALRLRPIVQGNEECLGAVYGVAV